MKKPWPLLFLLALPVNHAFAQQGGTDLERFTAQRFTFSLDHGDRSFLMAPGTADRPADSAGSLRHVAFLLWRDITFSIDPGTVPMRVKGGRDEESPDRFGIRLPLGIAYRFSDRPVELFVDLAPVRDDAPGGGLEFHTAVGLRWVIR